MASNVQFSHNNATYRSKSANLSQQDMDKIRNGQSGNRSPLALSKPSPSNSRHICLIPLDLYAFPNFGTRKKNCGDDHNMKILLQANATN